VSVEYFMSPYIVGHIEWHKMAWVPFEIWDEARRAGLDVPPMFASEGGRRISVRADAEELPGFIEYMKTREAKDTMQ
jgi:hypothetical protein